MRVTGRRRERTENTDHKKHLPSARGAGEQESSSGSSLADYPRVAKLNAAGATLPITECFTRARKAGLFFGGWGKWTLLCVVGFFFVFFSVSCCCCSTTGQFADVSESLKSETCIHERMSRMSIKRTSEHRGSGKKKKTTRKRFSPWPLLVVSVYN